MSKDQFCELIRGIRGQNTDAGSIVPWDQHVQDDSTTAKQMMAGKEDWATDLLSMVRPLTCCMWSSRGRKEHRTRDQDGSPGGRRPDQRAHCRLHCPRSRSDQDRGPTEDDSYEDDPYDSYEEDFYNYYNSHDSYDSHDSHVFRISMRQMLKKDARHV